MHMPHTRRGGAGLAAAIVVASLLAACSAAATPSPTPAQDPSALLAGSLAATSQVSGPLDITLSLAGKVAESDGTTADVSGSSLTATIDRANSQGELTVDLKGVQAGNDVKADVRVVGGTAYVQASPLGASWYSLPLAAAKAMVPSALPVPSAMPSFDPSAMLAPLLKNPGVTIASGGTQQLDGRDQDVVTVTVTGSTVAAWLAQAESTAGSAALPVPLPSVAPGMPDIPLTIWIDHQTDQLSKLSTTITEGGSSLTLSLTITAHSGSVSIQAPPADQTQSASQLLQMFMGSGGAGSNPFRNLFGSPTP
jgi:hypothetical protein